MDILTCAMFTISEMSRREVRPSFSACNVARRASELSGSTHVKVPRSIRSRRIHKFFAGNSRGYCIRRDSGQVLEEDN